MSVAPAKVMLHERFGYDEERIQQQLQLVGLGDRDHALVDVLYRDVLAPHAPAIIARFYRGLRGNERFWEIMSRGVSLPRLHRAQVLVLQGLGRDFDTFGYFETRLRIGVAHARHEVPLDLYLGSYSLLSQGILDAVPSGHPQAEDLRRLILKLVMLDISLVSATYHEADRGELERLLNRTRSAAHVQRERARRDSLTTVFRREHVEEVLDTAIDAARANRRPLSVAMIDVDNFKLVNDQHGHPVGDEVLRQMAARMRLATRDMDTLGRYGGEEFLLILSGIGPSAASEIVERVRAQVSQTPIEVGSLRLPITVSVGVSTLEPGDEDRAPMIERADRALYAAKTAGRDCVRSISGRGGAESLPIG